MKPNQTQRLIDYFKGKEAISRRDLHDYFTQSEGEIKNSTLAWRIYDLKKQAILSETSRGTYSLFVKPTYNPPVDKSITDIASIFSKNYRDSTYCIWNIDWINEFAVHQFSRDIVIFETEKDLIESVGDTLVDHKYTSIVSSLNAYLISYSSPGPLIILQPVISRAPVASVVGKKGDTVIVPTLEKMLVDIYVNSNVFHFLAGSEMVSIYNHAIQRYAINLTTLLSYAGRRGKREELSKFLKDHFPEIQK